MLTFNVKKEWFEKIKSGEKTHEYRRMTDYWRKRLNPFRGDLMLWPKPYADAVKLNFIDGINKDFRFDNKICFCCGYPRKTDKKKRIYGKIKSITSNIDGRQTDLKIDEPVFDIKFELVKEKE